VQREKINLSGVCKSLIIGGNRNGWVGGAVFCIYFRVLFKWHV
jgi:hypothetical protein